MALSGGADSCALLLALWAAGFTKRGGLAAHIIHNLRSRDEAIHDSVRCRSLCDRLGVELIVAEIDARCEGGREPGTAVQNLEAIARRERYLALHRIASNRAIPFIAVAHHADDQLETMLMHLIRGSGPRGLSGMADRRPLRPLTEKMGDSLDSSPCMLIRPMISAVLTRTDTVEICQAAGWEWVEDSTNRDTSRLRAAIRHTVLPPLKATRPNSEAAVVRASALLREAADLCEQTARRSSVADVISVASMQEASRNQSFDRAALREHPRIVLGHMLRASITQVIAQCPEPSVPRLDRLTSKVLRPMISAIRDQSTDPRSFRLDDSIVVAVTAQLVTIACVAKHDPSGPRL